MTVTTAIEWGGALLGLLGASVLSANHRLSGWGFLAFLASNVCWIAFSLLTQAYGLLVMQLGFTLTSVVGLFRWLLLPPFPKSRKK